MAATRVLGAALILTITAAACSGGAVAVVPDATAEPARLLVLHTNDNWGETRICG